jgi:enoyl-CoA hydratase/carnithine racemase
VSETVWCDLSAEVATIALNRPEKRNAIDRSILDGLAAAFERVAETPSVRAVLLRGNGGVFSSGIDHTLLMELFQKSREIPFRHLHAQLQAVFDAIERLEKPVIAVAEKYCVGLALELALACDFRIASKDCVLGLPEVAFGIIPDGGGTTRLVRAIGPARAREMIMTGCVVTSSRAERLGLVTEVAADPQSAGEGLARQLASLPPRAVGAAKVMVLRSADVDSASSLKLEGWMQSALIEDPSLPENFANALAFIKAQMASPLD